MSALQKTVLHPVHSALGGTLVDFGGWEMPLWYPTGAVKEHLAVLTQAGLFDTSHMGVVLVEGPGVRDFLNFAVTKDISGLKLGRAAYGIVLTERGEAVDDAIVYPLDEERFGLVVNAGMGARVVEHMRKLPGGDRFKWTDLAGQLAKIDLQGPAAFKIIRGLVADSAAVFEKFPYFSFKGDFDLGRTAISLGGAPALLSRTGYTGELGFEIFIAAEKGLEIWEKLMAAGQAFGLTPCGLAARDSLRAGAVLPLSHQDIGPWPFINNPWPWALPYDKEGGFTKDFYGRAALNPSTANHTLPFVGFDPRKVEARESRVLLDDQEIGVVLTVVADMGIGRVEGRVVGLASPDKPEGWSPKGLVCGFIKVDRKLAPGDIVYLKDARRQLKVEICEDIRPGRSARNPLV